MVTASQGLVGESAVLNPHVIAGAAAIVIALLSLLVYVYRRRLFILWWVGAWLLITSPYISFRHGWFAAPPD